MNSLKAAFQLVSDPVQQLHNRFVMEESLSREWITAYRELRSPNKNRVNEKAKYLVDRLRDSWQHLLRDRATRSLTHNDEQFHALEKIKITETGKRVKTLLNDDVRPAVEQEAESLADWYKKAQTIFLQTKFLFKDVGSHEDTLYDIRVRLVQIKEDLKEDIKNDGEVSKIANETTVNEQNIESMKRAKEMQCYLRVRCLNIHSCAIVWDHRQNNMPKFFVHISVITRLIETLYGSFVGGLIDLTSWVF